jgi:hypothetical protein
MNFTISGATPMGPVSFRRATAPAAAKKARDLSRLGLRDIRVVDEEGRAWALDELEGTGAPAPMKDTATRSQAFHGAAREPGCDKSETRFDSALRTAAKNRPSPVPAVNNENKQGNDAREED